MFGLSAKDRMAKFQEKSSSEDKKPQPTNKKVGKLKTNKSSDKLNGGEETKNTASGKSSKGKLKNVEKTTEVQENKDDTKNSKSGTTKQSGDLNVKQKDILEELNNKTQESKTESTNLSDVKDKSQSDSKKTDKVSKKKPSTENSISETEKSENKATKEVDKVIKKNNHANDQTENKSKDANDNLSKKNGQTISHTSSKEDFSKDLKQNENETRFPSEVNVEVNVTDVEFGVDTVNVICLSENKDEEQECRTDKTNEQSHTTDEIENMNEENTDVGFVITANVEETESINKENTDAGFVITANVEETESINEENTDAGFVISADVEETESINKENTDAGFVISANAEEIENINVANTDSGFVITGNVEEIENFSKENTDTGFVITANVEDQENIIVENTDAGLVITANVEDEENKNEEKTDVGFVITSSVEESTNEKSSERVNTPDIDNTAFVIQADVAINENTLSEQTNYQESNNMSKPMETVNNKQVNASSCAEKPAEISNKVDSSEPLSQRLDTAEKIRGASNLIEIQEEKIENLDNDSDTLEERYHSIENLKEDICQETQVKQENKDENKNENERQNLNNDLEQESEHLVSESDQDDLELEFVEIPEPEAIEVKPLATLNKPEKPSNDKNKTPAEGTNSPCGPLKIVVNEAEVPEDKISTVNEQPASPSQQSSEPKSLLDAQMASPRRPLCTTPTFRPLPEEFYKSLFYFSGMGSLIGSALSEGIYVPDMTAQKALSADEYEAASELKRRRNSVIGHAKVVETARHQANELSADLKHLQGVLSGLPTFQDVSTSMLSKNALRRSSIEKPITQKHSDTKYRRVDLTEQPIQNRRVRPNYQQPVHLMKEENQLLKTKNHENRSIEKEPVKQQFDNKAQTALQDRQKQQIEDNYQLLNRQQQQILEQQEILRQQSAQCQKQEKEILDQQKCLTNVSTPLVSKSPPNVRPVSSSFNPTVNLTKKDTRQLNNQQKSLLESDRLEKNPFSLKQNKGLKSTLVETPLVKVLNKMNRNTEELDSSSSNGQCSRILQNGVDSSDGEGIKNQNIQDKTKPTEARVNETKNTVKSPIVRPKPIRPYVNQDAYQQNSSIGSNPPSLHGVEDLKSNFNKDPVNTRKTEPKYQTPSNFNSMPSKTTGLKNNSTVTQSDATNAPKLPKVSDVLRAEVSKVDRDRAPESGVECGAARGVIDDAGVPYWQKSRLRAAEARGYMIRTPTDRGDPSVIRNADLEPGSSTPYLASGKLKPDHVRPGLTMTGSTLALKSTATNQQPSAYRPVTFNTRAVPVNSDLSYSDL